MDNMTLGGYGGNRMTAVYSSDGTHTPVVRLDQQYTVTITAPLIPEGITVSIPVEELSDIPRIINEIRAVHGLLPLK